MMGIRGFVIQFFSVVVAFTLVSGLARAEFKPVLKPKPKEWNMRIQEAGIEMSLQEFGVLKGFEASGVLERQAVAIDLPFLAESYPEQAKRWIKAAVSIIEDSNFKAKNNESFKRTRTGFLRALVADLQAEGTPHLFTTDRMLSDFKKYRGSARTFYEISSVYWGYANLVEKGMVKPGESGLKEAAIQYKISEYKTKMDIYELTPEQEAELHSHFEWKFLHPDGRKIASVNSAQQSAR